ncbi:MAG TPA: TnsA-like heteromeric transposase endonuclease subunit [Ornithinibacter sp.]|mgnify:FL=1|nr:TnsA-like heteromeric transposase endonuclease subunit [Ornithinibacter sp.]
MTAKLRNAVEFRYTSRTGEDVVTTIEAAPGADVAHGQPVRRFGSYARMGHYPGWWWSATMGDLVGYESLLERDRLMLADFERDVVAVASQPFGLSGRDGDVLRRHVPDYLLLRRDGSVEVIDVKPTHLVDKPEVADVLRWTGQVLAERGWRYSVWSGADALRLTNIRFLAQGRRAHLVDAEAVRHLQAHGAVGRSVGEVLRAASRSNDFTSHSLRAGMTYLLWHQLWQICLDEPFDSTTRIDEIREELG